MGHLSFTVTSCPSCLDNPAVFPVQPVVYALRGTNATMSATVSSEPSPTEENIAWYYKGIRLSPGDRYSFAATNQELTIVRVEVGDYGAYTCEVNTTAGSDRATIMLVEPSKCGVCVYVQLKVVVMLSVEL